MSFSTNPIWEKREFRQRRTIQFLPFLIAEIIYRTPNLLATATHYRSFFVWFEPAIARICPAPLATHGMFVFRKEL